MQKTKTKQATRFYKLHGAGNDLIVLHSEEMPSTNKAAFVRKIAHRQLGVGCDQVVELLSTKPLAIQIWNQDGSQAEMCANGSRTFLFLAHKLKWISRSARKVKIQISGGSYEAIQKTPGNYELCLGTPEIGYQEVLQLGKEKIPFTPVKTGNPHAVIWMTGKKRWSPKLYNFRWYGAHIETHKVFPLKTNVEFIRALRVKGKKALVIVDAWERGAGATLSCGSGAVAVAAVVRKLTKVDRISVRMTDFVLQIRFEGDRAFLSGPCALVAMGYLS